MNRVYLVRHGENPANLTKEFSCRKVDYPLTEKGQLQARQTGSYFSAKNIQAIYTSPLKRTVESAEIISKVLDLNFEVMENFREVNVGLLEELPVSEENWNLHNEIIVDWIEGKRQRSFPGGENFLMLRQRMLAGLEKALDGRSNQNIIILGHGGIFTLTLQEICPEVDIKWLIKAENHNCSISELLIEKKCGNLQGKLIQWALTSHLTGTAAELVSGNPDPATFQSKNQI
ncbi:MAG TPA: histidine phosphatase family protein [Anaerolineales bacterium]|nr:histidine phosphatase family protein [Anaerolineales bacterium]